MARLEQGSAEFWGAAATPEVETTDAAAATQPKLDIATAAVHVNTSTSRHASPSNKYKHHYDFTSEKGNVDDVP